MSYQGWTNAKTWCVALCFDNDNQLLTQVLEQVKYGNGIRPFASQNISAIIGIAPWAWDDSRGLDDVNFEELRAHYLRKLKEGVLRTTADRITAKINDRDHQCPYCLASDKWKVIDGFQSAIRTEPRTGRWTEWHEHYVIECTNMYLDDDGTTIHCAYRGEIEWDDELEYEKD